MMHEQELSTIISDLFLPIQTPVIVLDPDTLDLDLISSNSHLMHSEVCVQSTHGHV